MFKGSGFYLTDYGKNAHASKGPAKPSTQSESAASGDAKSETKSTGEPKPATESKPAASPPPTKPSTE